MKCRTYRACELDPRSLVVPVADTKKCIRNIQRIAIESYETLYKSGNIDLETRDSLIKNIREYDRRTI